MNLLGRIPNFDDPIEALYICHENILKRMSTIERMAEQIESEGAEGFRRTVETWHEIFSFLRHNVTNHTKDEEEGLFPLLRQGNGEQVEKLAEGHDHATRIERSMAERFERLSDSGSEPIDSELQAFAADARALCSFYREHIREENEILFPIAQNVLTREQIDSLGDLMRRHRNISLPNL